MTPFMESKLSNIPYGFRERHGRQHAFLRVIEIIYRYIDYSSVCGMVLLDISKGYTCLPHDLLLAMIGCYGFNIDIKNLRTVTLLELNVENQVYHRDVSWNPPCLVRLQMTYSTLRHAILQMTTLSIHLDKILIPSFKVLTEATFNQ